MELEVTNFPPNHLDILDRLGHINLSVITRHLFVIHMYLSFLGSWHRKATNNIVLKNLLQQKVVKIWFAREYTV